LPEKVAYGGQTAGYFFIFLEPNAAVLLFTSTSRTARTDFNNDNWLFAKGDPTNTIVSPLKVATATTEDVKN
jgi:hypothetical protein